MENSVKALFFFSNLQFQRVMNCLAICFGVRFRRQGNALAIGGSAADGVRFLIFEEGGVARRHRGGCAPQFTPMSSVNFHEIERA